VCILVNTLSALAFVKIRWVDLCTVCIQFSRDVTPGGKDKAVLTTRLLFDQVCTLLSIKTVILKDQTQYTLYEDR